VLLSPNSPTCWVIQHVILSRHGQKRSIMVAVFLAALVTIVLCAVGASHDAGTAGNWLGA